MERKNNILYLIVDSFIRNGVPVSSNNLLEKYNLNMSSATIRNDMSLLEKEGYIKKSYKHSGRIPTKKAYKFYIDNLKKDSTLVSYAREKINNIFSKRDEDINLTIDEVIKLINKTTNTISVIKNELTDLYVEDIKIYDIKNNKILIICVLSNGKVIYEEHNNKDINFSDLEKAFKLISKRLIGSKLDELNDNVNYVINLISDQVKNIEFNFRMMIFDLINKLIKSNVEQQNSLSESFELVSKVKNKNEIKKIFKLIEENKIWDLIERYKQKDELFIEFDDDEFNELSVINKTFKLKDGRKTIAVIGPKNQDYKQIITMIDLLEEKIIE